MIKQVSYSMETEIQQNVFGEEIVPCSHDPLTGFYRDGCCATGNEDVGSHTVCIVATADFLAFSKACGNDLSAPMPDFGFPGLKPEDQWCLCALRWQEAFEAGKAPKIKLASTNIKALELVKFEDLKSCAIDIN